MCIVNQRLAFVYLDDFTRSLYFPDAVVSFALPSFQKRTWSQSSFSFVSCLQRARSQTLICEGFFLQFHSLPVSSPSALRTSVFLSTLVAAALIREQHSHPHTLMTTQMYTLDFFSLGWLMHAKSNCLLTRELSR